MNPADVNATNPAIPAVAVRDVRRDAYDTNPAVGVDLQDHSRHWPLRTAAVGYSIAWIVGLLVVSSSTDVTSSGQTIVREDSPHVAALILQFILTEGLATLALLVVVVGLWRATARGRARTMTLLAGTGAVAISLAQAVLGVCLVAMAVHESNAILASVLTVVLNELDGIKMVLLAAMAFAVSAARARLQVSLPRWLLPTGIATGTALAVSALGYLTRTNALSNAAWASLPLLLVFVTACGLLVRPTR